VSREMAFTYGVIIEEGEEKGASYRSIFIIDRRQILRHSSVNDLDVGIDINDILRMLKVF
jgi:mitochondrial tryparedoxin peroxidase, trypanosomatid typical 2-Cys peroxiredoxin